MERETQCKERKKRKEKAKPFGEKWKAKGIVFESWEGNGELLCSPALSCLWSRTVWGGFEEKAGQHFGEPMKVQKAKQDWSKRLSLSWVQ